jgi:ABC-type tungstate transport system permease subunit
MGTQLKLHCE